MNVQNFMILAHINYNKATNEMLLTYNIMLTLFARRR